MRFTEAMTAQTPAGEPAPRQFTTSAQRFRWLTGELRAWQQEGLIDAPTAEAITSRYAVAGSGGVTNLPVRVILALGSFFVGIGLIWLVASNLDELSPLARFILVVAIWIALSVTGELTQRLVSGAFKLLSALAFGAVVFQAAQSLQVPAYRPHLLLAWAAGALLYAYARRSRGAAFVGIPVLAAWYVWQVMDASANLATFTIAVLLGSVVAVALAALHPQGWRGFGRLWLAVGAVMSLVGVFAAALPYGDDDGLPWAGALGAGVILVIGLAAAALWRSTKGAQIALGVAVAALLLGAALSLWRPFPDDMGMVPDEFTFAMWVRTGLAIIVFLAVAGGWAVVGARESLPVISVAATAGVVVFVTFQSFAVFAPIISGATLFLLVGAVMIITGVVAERARRRIGSEVTS